MVSIGLLTLGQRVPSLTERFSLAGLVPGAQAGALTVALASVCEGLHTQGLLAALSIGVPAVTLSRTSGQVLQRVVDGRTQNAWVTLGVATVGLLVLFPFGLMGRWWPAVLIGGLVLSVAAHVLAEEKTVQAPSRPRRNLTEGGTLRLPVFVPDGNRDVARLVGVLSRPGLHTVVVEGPEGVGKSRFADELRVQLEATLDWRVGVGQAEARLGEVGSTAFALVSQAMSEVLEAESVELAALHDRRAALSELAGAASEAALEMLPGVGVLLSLGESQDREQITLERMRRDLVSSVVQVARDQPLMLVFDDVQWADESSLGLIDHLQSALADPDPALKHPVVLLLLQRPGPGPHTRLGAPDEWIQLAAFGSEGVERLLAGSGVSAPPEFAQMVRDRVGGSPRHVLELVAELDAAGLLTREQQALVVPPGLGRSDIEEAVPAHLKDLEVQRLERLDDRQRVLLHAAAQCGRRFDVDALAQGLGQDRIPLLEVLWVLQAEHGLVEDLDDDSRFRFRTELMRSILVDLARRDDGKGVHKLLKEFHWRVVQSLVSREGSDWDELRDSERVVRHAVLAGQRAEGHVVQYATRAASNAARRCAWPEAMEWVRVAREPERADSADSHSAAALDLVEAKVLRGVGGERRREALELLRGLVDSEHVDQVEVVQMWFETAFELRTRSSAAELLEQIRGVRQRVDTAGRQTLVEAVCDFYEVLARAEHEGVRPGPHPGIAGQLAEQAGTLRTVRTDRERERDLLLARILQAMAQRVERQQDYLAACRESLALKERHGDLAGQALTKGMLGNYFLWWAPKSDPPEARRWLEEDLDLVERMGANSALSSLHNRIALSFAMQGQHDRALERAEQAFRVARRHHQGADAVFAAFAVFEYALELGDLDRINALGRQLVDPPRGWPWATASALFGELPEGLRAAKAEELGRFVLPDEPWVDRLTELLSG